MTPYRADHYYSYEEMTAWLREVADAHPDVARLESMGRSAEGRELWVMTLTDWATGHADDRPAYWIDANTHASEVTGSAAALYTIADVVNRKGAPEIAALLAERALIVAPRVNPDGAEYCLTGGGLSVRSAPRRWPDPAPAPGFVHEDVDGDGEVLQLRVKAPDGAWKVSAQDARLLIPRAPWDTEEADGPFYHLYGEGRFEADAWRDPQHPVGEAPYQLDFNRNYPVNWQPQHEQHGAGDYPLSEPETRAIVDYLLAHRNIGGMLSYHTYSGVLLRPFTDRPDQKMPKLDLKTYELFGARCEALTGYPCKSTFHDFCYDPNSLTRGVFDDWAYEHYGVHCYTMELWCPWKAAGLDFSDDFLRFFYSRTEADELAMLRWNDEALDGAGFADWRAFEHPQLGPVELGGWRWMYTWRNTPPHLLEQESRNAHLFALDHARGGPKPSLTLDVEPLGGDLWRLHATMRNDGYLPTYITEMALKNNLVRELHLDLTLSEGVELIDGFIEQRTPHLDGLANHTAVWSSALYAQGQTHAHLLRRSWLLRGEGRVEVAWWGDRIGRLVAGSPIPPAPLPLETWGKGE